MIDLHCHILPGIDDGAKNLNESLALARHAVEAGITHSVLTPHQFQGRFENNKQSIKSTFDSFKQSLQDENIPLQIGFASEVRIVPEIMDWVLSDSIPFLGKKEGKNIMLLELPHSHVPAGTQNMVNWLATQNITPIIAHPERNKELMKNPIKIIPLYNAGCLFQVTAGSVAGEFGEASRLTAVQFLKEKFVTILATDAHNLKHRPPELTPGRIAAEQIIGESASWDLVDANPRAIAECHFLDLAVN